MDSNKRKIAGWLANSFVVIGAILVLALSFGGFFPQVDWRLGWYSHPRPHFAVLSIAAIIWLAVQKKWLLALLPFLAFAINFVVLAPYFIGSPDQTLTVGPSLSILHLNTNKGEASFSDIEQFGADVVFLQEVTPELVQTFEEKLPNYRLVFSHPLENTHGSAMLIANDTKLDVFSPRINHLPEDNVRPLLSVNAVLDGQDIQLLSMHAIRPHHIGADEYQQVEYDAVATWGKAQIERGDELVMIGDFNATPWSQRFKGFLEDSQTADSMLGFGIQNSWIVFLPMWLGLPIDHAVVSNGLVVVERETESVRGSDHGLLFVRLALIDS
ncbi:MAG: endonuclease/exonuclease/phosphatase family protein [Anaerolineae bacterium]